MLRPGNGSEDNSILVFCERLKHLFTKRGRKETTARNVTQILAVNMVFIMVGLISAEQLRAGETS